MHTVEDYIEIIAGMQPTEYKFELDSPDYKLITSFARQVFKGTGFTDRQHELAKTKLLYYKDQLDQKGYKGFEENLDNLRIPLRSIDRSRYIKIVKNEKDDYTIAVRFTFQKKFISLIEEMKKKLGSDNATYNPVEKIHSFPYSEYNLYTLVNIFKEKNFELDDLVKELYDKINSFKSDNYIPGIYDYNLKNISTLAVDCLNKELGSPSSNNLLLYKDRSILHGLNYFDQHDLDKCSKEYSSLSVKIANRTNTNIKVLKAKYTFDLLVQSLMELDRFPIMFIVPNDSAYDTISEIHQHMRNVVSPEECSVMFRLDNQGEGLEFNNYIKKEKINNKLDVNSKVVYIIDNKIPKPLLKSEWEPKAIVVADTGNIPNTRRVLECFCEKDLIIFYESSDSPSTRYFFNRKLETI